MKTCSKCLLKKENSEFSPANDKKDGLSSHCKSCRNKTASQKLEIKRAGKRPYSTYYINQDKINDDSFKMWYIAGLWAADGNISKKQRRISITLHPKDLEILEIIKEYFEYNGPINYYKNKYRVLTFSGVSQIIEVLQTKFNLSPNKSLTLEPPPTFPSLEHALSFIVGYIDGDGCIYKSDKSKQLQILGTEKMLKFILNTFNQIVNITLQPRPASSPNIFQINLYVSENGKYATLIKKLLSLDVPKMKRKWDKLS